MNLAALASQVASAITMLSGERTFTFTPAIGSPIVFAASVQEVPIGTVTFDSLPSTNQNFVQVIASASAFAGRSLPVVGSSFVGSDGVNYRVDQFQQNHTGAGTLSFYCVAI